MNATPCLPGQLSEESPWPGLRPFTEADGAYFFGRERDTAELLNLVRRAPVVVFYGESGLGKTSLLQAALFPELRRLDFLPLRLRLDHGEGAPPLAQQIKAALISELDRLQVAGPRPGADETLWEYFHRRDLDLWGPRNRLLVPVIVLDQFEEVFTIGRKNERAAAGVVQFAKELESLIEHRPPDAVRARLETDPNQALRYNFQRQSVKFIFSLREDFLPHLDPWRVQMPTLLMHRFRLERMTGAQALEVVQRGGRHLVDSLVAHDIVDFVSASRRRRSVHAMEQREVEPALLSVVCDELNRRRIDRHQTHITADLLSGEREGIIEGFYKRAFDGVDERVRDWVEDELLTDSGYRNRAALEDALKGGLSEAAFEQLVDRRILHREERGGVIWLELTHDILSDPAMGGRAARAQRRAEDEARQAAERLAAAEAARADEEGRRKEAEHLSRVASAARRRAQHFAIATGTVAVLAVGAFAWAWSERSDALAARISAQGLIHTLQHDVKDQLTTLGYISAAGDISTNINNYYLKNPPQQDEDVSAAADWFDQYAGILQEEGRLPEAQRVCQESLSDRIQLAQKHPADSQVRAELSASYDHLGAIYEELGNLGDALTNCQKSFDIRKKLSDQDKNDAQRWDDLSESYDHLGDICEDQRNFSMALTNHILCLEIKQRVVGQNTNNSTWQSQMAKSYDDLGVIYEDMENFNAASNYFQQSFSIRDKLVESQDKNAQWQDDLSESYDHVGDIYTELGALAASNTNFEAASNNLAVALRYHKLCLAIKTKLANQDPNNYEWQKERSTTFDHVSEILLEQAKLEVGSHNFTQALADRQEALDDYEQSLEIDKRLYRLEPDDTVWRDDLNESSNQVRRALEDLEALTNSNSRAKQ